MKLIDQINKPVVVSDHMKVAAKALQIHPVEIITYAVNIEDTSDLPDVHYYPAAEFLVGVWHYLTNDQYVVTSVTVEGQTPIESLVLSASRVLAHLEGWKHWNIAIELTEERE